MSFQFRVCFPASTTHALLVLKFISCHFITYPREKEIELHNNNALFVSVYCNSTFTNEIVSPEYIIFRAHKMKIATRIIFSLMENKLLYDQAACELITFHLNCRLIWAAHILKMLSINQQSLICTALNFSFFLDSNSFKIDPTKLVVLNV